MLKICQIANIDKGKILIAVYLMFLSYSLVKEDAENKDIAQQPHIVPATTQPSLPQETDGASVDSATSIIASTIPPKPEAGAQEQATAQQERGNGKKEGGAVSTAEPACKMENHLWATLEEKQGSEGAEEKDGKQQQEENGVKGG